MQINIHEAKTHFSKLLKKVSNGEEIVIARDNTPIAKLVPITKKESERKLGSAKGQMVILADFDQIPEEFTDIK